MARKKVIVEYIANDPTRKSTCKKRTMGVIKKAGQLSILCGVDVCFIIWPEGESSEVKVWPSLPEVMRMIDRLRSMPELDQCKKKMDGEDYVRERIAKAQEQLRKAEHDNRQRETMLLLHDAMVGRRPNLEDLTVEQVISIGWKTENLIKNIKDCIAYRSGQQAGVQADQLHYPAAVADVEAPRQQQGSVMDVVKAGWDLNAVACSGSSRSGSGSYGSFGAGDDIMQLGNMDAGFAWAARGTYFPPI